MICIYCLQENTKVVNSRAHKKNASVWRRRHCPSCQKTITTYERVSAELLPGVIANDNKPKTFSHGKLLMSIYKELPDTNDDPDIAEALAITVEQKLLIAQVKELTSEIIARYTYETLVAFDKIAGARYGLSHGISTTIRQKSPKK